MTLVFNGHDMSGPTANRPTNADIGQPFFDTTLGVLLVWNGTIWDPIGNEMAVTTVAAAGTNQATGGLLVEGFNIVTSADGTKGVTLPVAAVGLEVQGYNNSASALPIYPAVSGTLNGGSANASVTIAAKSKFTLVGTSATNFAIGYTASTVTSLAGTGGALTLPAGADTLVGRATTDTLTNKTLTTPTIAYNAANPAVAGTTQGTATAITTPAPGVLHVTGANATAGVALPAATAGAVYHLKNDDTANAVLKVYPNGTDTINALGASNAISLAAKVACSFFCTTNGAWYTSPLLPS